MLSLGPNRVMLDVKCWKRVIVIERREHNTCLRMNIALNGVVIQAFMIFLIGCVRQNKELNKHEAY